MERTEGFPGETGVVWGGVSPLVEASLRISESLDFDRVLQGVLDNACALADARFGMLTPFDETGDIRLEEAFTFGVAPDQAEQLREMLTGSVFCDFFEQLPGPTRLPDLEAHFESMGFPGFGLPVPVNPPISFLGVVVRHGGESIGAIYLAEKESGPEFTDEDQENLVMFAATAALVMANSRRFRDEQRARADLEALIETSPVGVMVLDAATGLPVTINRETRRIISDLIPDANSVEELVGLATVRRADGSEISLGELTLVEAMQAGETVRAEEITVSLPDGRSVPLLVNATPIRSGNGDVESFIVTIQDLAPLEELVRLRAEFLGVVSHELRAPLSSIKGSVATLLGESDKMDPVEMRQFFRLIDQQADRMRELIGNLMDVVRIETGSMPVSPEPEEVARLVELARESFLQGGGRRNLQIELGPDLPPVLADRRRVTQVLENLLTNAERFSPEWSTITIRAELEGVHVAIAVSDQGRGVSAEDLPNLFRKFTRLDGDEADWAIAGSGLGLSICKGIVEAHGGRIRAESEGPGLGMTITLTLPAAEEASAGPAPVPEVRNYPGRQRPQCVLAVDDDPEALRYIRDTLTEAGFTTMVTAFPEDAFRLMETSRPDLVLLDWLLPEADGIELLPSILEIADVPVIFLSAYGREDVIVRAFELGATDYVIKPFSPTELVARVRAALRRSGGPRQAMPTEPYASGELAVNYHERRVSLAGQPVQLTATEYQLLSELTRNAGVVMTHDELLQRVWGLSHSGDARLVRGVVKRLRAKLGDDVKSPRYVHTETGVGYRMSRPDDPGEGEASGY